MTTKTLLEIDRLCDACTPVYVIASTVGCSQNVIYVRMQETGRKAKHIHPRAVYRVTRIKTGRAVVGTLEECAEQLGVKKATLESARVRWLNQGGHRPTKWKIEKLGERRWKGWEEAPTGTQEGACRWTKKSLM